MSVDLNYIDIPVLLMYNIAGPVNIHAGPQFGILTKAESAGQDIKDQFKNNEFLIVAGIGVDLPMGLSGSFRYITGLSDLNDGAFGESAKTSMFQLSVGFQLIGLGD